MSAYPFIEAEKAEQHSNVVKACELLGVSRSAFYQWHRHEPSGREVRDDELGEEIEAVYDKSRGTYGWPRVHAKLRRQGVCVSRKRVARIMRQRGLVGRCRRRWCRTTISDPDVGGAVDRLKRAFGPGTVELDRVYVGDITYVWTWEGWALPGHRHRSHLSTGGGVRITCELLWSVTPCVWPSPTVGLHPV